MAFIYLFIYLFILAENAACSVDELSGLAMGQLYSLMSAGWLIKSTSSKKYD